MLTMSQKFWTALHLYNTAGKCPSAKQFSYHKAVQQEVLTQLTLLYMLNNIHI